MLASTAQAEENLWVYTKGTDTRPQGSYEFKLGEISKIGKDSGSYFFHDIRPEVEYGINDRLTIGAELMIFNHDYSVDTITDDGSSDDELGPYFDTQGGDGGRFTATSTGGYEITTKYNILSPYKDAFGLSLAAGYEGRRKYRLDGADIEQQSYTISALLQKNYLDDTLVFAFNWKTEFERRKSGTGSDYVLEEEIAFDVSAGVSYRFKPKHFAGLEIRSQSDYLNPQEDGAYSSDLQRSSFDLTDIRLGTMHQIGTYVGPTYHYAEQDWWFTAGILLQVAGGGSAHAYNRSGLNFDEHERVHLSFTYGKEF